LGTTTTTFCRISALAVCAGVGVALTGATGGTFLAAMTGSAMGGAAGNFFHQMVDGMISWFGGQKHGTTTLPANHDLDGLTASAIKLVLETARDRLLTDDPKRGVLERLAKTPVATIVEVMQAEDTRPVGDDEIAGTLGTPAGGQTTTVATPEYWQAFIEALMQRTGAAQRPTAMNTAVRDFADVFRLAAKAVKDATKDLFATNISARAKDPGAADATVFAAGLLHAHVAAFANDILRETFGPQGRFFVAALFNMLNTISANTRQPPPGAKFTVEQIDQIKACLPEAVNAAIARSRALPAPADAESLAAAREMQAQASALATTLQGMGATLDAVQKTLHGFAADQRETLTRIEQAQTKMGTTLAIVATDTGHIPAMAKDLADVKARVAAIASGHLSAATLKTANNLAAAKIAPNQFFTGRTDELTRLHAALAGGSVAIVHALTGEGGIGKTELAKVYALIYADTYDSAWWLDASSAALRGELVKVYERATGTQAPQNAQTDDLCQALVDHWKATRPLIILDNVDDPANFTLFSALPSARVLATTRQHHKTLQGVEAFRLGVLPLPDAVALMRKEIAKSRADVTEADLTAIATELDGHALAVALAGAYLANYPSYSAKEVLAKLKASKVGDVDPVADDAEHDALGLSYRRSVAASLSLSFAIPQVAAALPVLAAASFLHPTGITIEWLMAGTGWDRDKVIKAARTLATSSIIKDEKTISLHRLTQGVARSRPDVAGGEQGHAALSRLLAALIDLFKWPGTQAEQLVDHVKTPARLAAVAHAEAVIVHAEALAPPAGKGAAAPFPGTPSPAEAKSAGEPGAKVARLRAEMAHRLADAGQLADAARHIDSAIAYGEAHRPQTEVRLHIDYGIRATIRQNRGLLKEAEADLQKSIDWCEAQSPRDERGLAIDYASRASIRQLRGDLAGAEADIKKSIDWFEAQSPRDERILAIWYASRARIRQDRGDLAGAEADLQKSIDWAEAQSPRDERSLAIRYASRASIRQLRGDLAGAEADIKKSIDWVEAQSPRDQRSLAIWYASRAHIRQDRGDLAGAEADLQKSIDWAEAQTPRDQRSLAIRYAARARIRRDRGDLAGAEKDLDRSIGWYESQKPLDQRGVVFLYQDKALLLAEQGRFAEAKAAIDESVRLHTAVFGADHEWTQLTVRRQHEIHAGRSPN
jgi:hypothetical protein